MSKIILDPIAETNNTLAINNNFDKIEDEFQDKVLYRDNPSGEPNEMLTPIDMNGQRIFNLPPPIADHEPARYSDFKEASVSLEAARELVEEFIGTAEQAVNDAEAAAAQSAASASAAALSATVAGNNASIAITNKEAAEAAATAADASEASAAASANAADISEANALASAGIAEDAADLSTANAAQTASDSAAAITASTNAQTYASQAGVSATSAANSATTALTASTEAQNTVLEAKAWATKTDGPVEDSLYSAKHYAEASATNPGMPVYPLSAIPTTNQGPIIYVYNDNAWFGGGSGMYQWIAARNKYVLQDSAPLFSVHWFPSRTSLPESYVPADGQFLGRSSYPSATANLSKVPITSEAVWTSAATYHGYYSTGDGSTTFRIPDYNGKTALASWGSVFLSGDGLNGAPNAGEIHGSRNLAHNHGVTDPGHVHLKATATGVSGSNVNADIWGGYGSANPQNIATFSAVTGITIQNSGSADARPVTVTGVWAIKLY